jgi:hypothetical protein
MAAQKAAAAVVASQHAAITPPMIALGLARQGQVATQPAVLAPPMLEESHLLRNGNSVTGLVMTFSKPLDPATAQDLKNYQVFPQTRAAGDGTVSAAVYNPAQDSVTLILAQPVTLKPSSRGVLFVVNNPSSDGKSESTITDTSGQALQSTGDGQPDGVLLAQFKARGSSPGPLSFAAQKAGVALFKQRVAKYLHSPAGVFDAVRTNLLSYLLLTPIH